MSTLYAAMLGSNAYLLALTNSAYAFGTGDFTVSAMAMGTAPGPLVSRQEPGVTSTGFVLGVDAGGAIFLQTEDGSGARCAGRTGPTSVLDGDCHAITAIRQGGAISIFVDGQAVATAVQGSGPLNVDCDGPLTMGFSEQPTYWSGMLMNVGVWNLALSGDALVRAQFGLVSASDLGLQGYWALDATPGDRSSKRNRAVLVGAVRYMPCLSCRWTQGVNGYAFCEMANTPGADEHADLHGDMTLTTSRELDVPAGTPALVGAIMAAGDQPAFPTGATVTITDPSGVTYDQDVNTDTAFVKTVGGQPWAFALRDPAPGNWRVTVTTPPALGFALQFHTVPAAAVVDTVKAALEPLYDDPTGADSLGSWYGVFLGVAAGAVVGAFVVGAVIVTGGVATPALFYVGATFCAVAQGALIAALHELDTESRSGATAQVAGMAGFEEASGSVLLADQNIDDVTRKIYERRKERVYARVTASKFNKTRRPALIAADDTRGRLATALRGFANGYLSISGHGSPNAITGWPRRGPEDFAEVLEVGRYDAAEPAGKIIHHLGCSAGAVLGPDLVSHGAIAYFGYNDVYWLSDLESNVFIDCDAMIDGALLIGATCEDAHSATIAAYDGAIAALRARGAYMAAGYLETNRDRLVGPSTNAKFGAKNARLT